MEKVEFAREWIDMIMDVCLIFLYRESIFKEFNIFKLMECCICYYLEW